MGVRVNDRVFRELRAKIGEVADRRVKVGVLESSDEAVTVTNEDGKESEITMVELAAIHEYGAPGANIPERSFIRRTFSEPEGAEAMREFLAEQAEKILKGELTPATALKQLGAWGAAAVRARIRQGIPPPNAEATVQRKGSSTPLVDTGGLINAVSWEIVEAKDGGE